MEENQTPTPPPEKDCPKCPKCLPEWLAQFGDLMSLLLVFFVLLLSMSVMDDKKIIEYLAHMKQSLGVMENSNQTEIVRLQSIDRTTEMTKTSESMEQTMDEITESIIELNRRAKYNKEEVNDEMDTEDFAKLELGKEGFILKLPSSLLFGPGKYEIEDKEMVKMFFLSLGEVLKKTPADLQVEITGYTSRNENKYLNDYVAPYDLWQLAFFRSQSLYNEFKKSYYDYGKNYGFSLISNGNTDRVNFKEEDKNSRVEIYLKSKVYKSKLEKNESTLFDKIGDIDGQVFKQ